MGGITQERGRDAFQLVRLETASVDDVARMAGCRCGKLVNGPHLRGHYVRWGERRVSAQSIEPITVIRDCVTVVVWDNLDKTGKRRS